MTRKDYRQLAAALRSVPSVNQWDTWFECVNAVADACAQENTHFDHARFLAACGVSQ